LHVTV